jgi:exosortase
VKFELPKLDNRDWILIGLFTAAVIFAFHYMLRFAWAQWWETNGYYQHGVFVPFLVGYMIYRMRDDLKKVEVRPAPLGMGLLILSVLLAWWGSHVLSQFVSQVGFMLFIVGACIYTFGTKMTRRLTIPIILMGFMLPLPEYIFTQFTNVGQVYSTKIAVKMLDVLGFAPTMINNSQIHLDNYELYVGVPCSGFKLTMALLMFALFFSSIAKFNWWRIGVMFVVLVPVALVVNSWRIAMIGVFGENFGERAGSWFHDYGSYLELVIAYGVLFWLARRLGWKD